MKKFFHHMFVTLLMAFMILFCACSVNERREEDSFEVDSQKAENDVTQMDVDFNEPIRVFYMERESGLLTNFAALYPEIELERCPIYPNFEGQELDIAYWAEKWGDPDIVLLNDPGYWDIEEEYKNGQVEDIRQYCAEDDTLDVSNYVGGTFEVFDNGEAMLGLPLSWYKRCLIVKESQLANSELEGLSEGYTGRELFEAMLAEVKKEQYEEKFCWLYPLAFSNNLTEVAPRIDGKFEMDEEMFKVLFEFSVLNETNYEIAREAFGNFSEHANQRHSEPALDPEFCPDGYFGTFLRGAPQVTAIYAKSIAAMDQDDVKLFWVPTTDNSEEYVGNVRDYAFIGKNSTRKQQAYEVIHMMMDMPITIMTQPSGVGSEIFSSVNIERSLEALDYFNDLEYELSIREVTGELFHTLEQQKLSQEELEEIKGVITGMIGLYANYSLEKGNELGVSYNDYRRLARETGRIDHTMCYSEMQKFFNVDKETENFVYVGNDVEEETTEERLEENEAEEAEEIKNIKETIRNTEVGETFFMGSVEQDNVLENGDESIEWIVLEKTEEKAFVISKRILEYLTFSKYDNLVGQDGIEYMAPQNFFTWRIDRNQQREWLEKYLYENGFTESEKAIIILTHNKTPGYKDNYDLQESDDFLYVPSKEDVEKYMPDISIRQAQMTAYVAEKAKKDTEEYVCWSLRTEGATPKYSMQILENGEFSSMYCSMPNGVRPVMWLDIS